ncbi:MAG: hypothetical protein QOD11_459, partial [Bradyrhizobium sp.]|nr:hypothetical protein [Bradyrhizobium sp.]
GGVASQPTPVSYSESAPPGSGDGFVIPDHGWLVQ